MIRYVSCLSDVSYEDYVFDVGQPGPPISYGSYMLCSCVSCFVCFYILLKFITMWMLHLIVAHLICGLSRDQVYPQNTLNVRTWLTVV